jgi:hypothetical protein
MTQAAVLAQAGNINGTFRNKIINGAMVINQRASSSYSSPANPTYTLDRWYSETNLSSQYTVAQNAGSVTPPAGFSNYLGVTNGSSYSVTTSDYAFISQRIEGYNWTDLAWGTTSAKSVTISFWVYTSVTGTYSFSFENPNTNNQSYSATYTISSPNTWTQISITIPGPTSGTWANNNGAAVVCRFSIGTANTSLIGSANAWSTGRVIATTGSQSIFGTSSSVWYITGVQIEAGTSASAFELRSYSKELMMCQRYYQTIGGPSNGTNARLVPSAVAYNSTIVDGGILFPVQMRAIPTLNSPSGSSYFVFYSNGTAVAFNTFSAVDITQTSCGLRPTSISTTQNYGGWFNWNSTAPPSGLNVGFSAEL